MNDRVKAYRERQKAAGLSQVSLWLDAPTVKLLKHAAEGQQRQPGEIVSLALHAWWATQAPTETPLPTSAPTPTAPPALPDPTQLRAMVRAVVQEVLAESHPTQPPENPDPLPRPSLYQWPISL